MDKICGVDRALEEQAEAFEEEQRMLLKARQRAAATAEKNRLLMQQQQQQSQQQGAMSPTNMSTTSLADAVDEPADDEPAESATAAVAATESPETAQEDAPMDEAQADAAAVVEEKKEESEGAARSAPVEETKEEVKAEPEGEAQEETESLVALNVSTVNPETPKRPSERLEPPEETEPKEDPPGSPASTVSPSKHIPVDERAAMENPDPFGGNHDDFVVCGDESTVLDDIKPHGPTMDTATKEARVEGNEEVVADEKKAEDGDNDKKHDDVAPPSADEVRLATEDMSKQMVVMNKDLKDDDMQKKLANCGCGWGLMP